jgi:hypothetical protein
MLTTPDGSPSINAVISPDRPVKPGAAAKSPHPSAVAGGGMYCRDGSCRRMLRCSSCSRGLGERPPRCTATVYHGRVVPAAIVLPHREWRRQLRRSCPEALPAAVIGGDPAYDRLVASMPHRERYRRALGVGGEERLVVVSSTWGPRSLHARHPELPSRLLTEASRTRYRVAVVLHPNIWHHHGSWQVRAWYADCLRRRVVLIPPEDWRGVLVAADRVIGDHGSVTYYAASVSVPTVVGTYPDDAIDPESRWPRSARSRRGCAGTSRSSRRRNAPRPRTRPIGSPGSRAG